MYVCLCVSTSRCSLSMSGHKASQKCYLVSALTGSSALMLPDSLTKLKFVFQAEGHNPDTGVRWKVYGGEQFR